MTARPPQGGEEPARRTEDASTGGTNPLAGPVVVWAILIGVAVVLAILAAIGFGSS